MSNFSKGLGRCLLDEPTIFAEYEYPELPPGVMYDANNQCRLQFGSSATVCTPPDEICHHLWCSVNSTCTTLLRPAAPGTTCRKHMVKNELIHIILCQFFIASIYLYFARDLN